MSEQETIPAETVDTDGWQTPEDNVFKFENKGDTFLGELVNSEKVSNGNMLYTFNTVDGVQKLWGTAQLDRALQSVPLGNEVRVIYNGKEAIPGTSKTIHKFDIKHRAKK